jgi:hypothetical protein
MIEHGTVVGNVSRTHRPCGACGELVESCEHVRSGARDRRRRAKRTPEQRAAANAARDPRRARLASDIARLRRWSDGR